MSTVVGLAALPAEAEPRSERGERLQQARERSGLLPLIEILKIVEQRYVGRPADVEVKAGKPEERTDVVYEVKLLTENGNVLKIRLDALTGAFLAVDGRGLVEARRKP